MNNSDRSGPPGCFQGKRAGHAPEDT
jgi:hypothetical protein